MERLNECPFCNGKNIPAQYIGEGQRTMLTTLNFLFGGSDGEYGDGIRLENGKLLAFQNSSGEYAEQMIEINYCPFCGKRLKEGATPWTSDT